MNHDITTATIRPRTIIRAVFQITVSLLILGTLSGCEDGIPTAGESKYSMKISFSQAFKTQTFLVSEKSEYSYFTGGGDTIALDNFRYLLSKFYLKKENGEVLSLGGYCFVNGKTGSSTLSFADIPIGNYKGIGFTVGLDSAINYGNPAQWQANHPLSPVHNNLHWDWLSGYIFFLADGTYWDSTTAKKAFTYHIALDSNKTAVYCTKGFSINANSEATIQFQVDRLFSNVEKINIDPSNDFSHSNESSAIIQRLRANLQNCFVVNSVTP